MAFLVKGHTFPSYYDLHPPAWTKRDPVDPFPFAIVVHTEDPQEAVEQARQIAQDQTGWCAKVHSIHKVDSHLANKQKCTVKWDDDWWTQPIYFVDVETTGLSPQNDRIVEFGFCKYNNESKQFEDPVSVILNEGVPIPQSLIDKGVNNITNEDLKDAPTFQYVLDTYPEVFGTDVLWIAHNRGFDFSFIKATLSRYNKQYIPPMMCSMEMAMSMELNTKNNKLQTLAKLYGIKEEQNHRAGDDAKMGGHIFLSMARNHRHFLSGKSARHIMEFFDGNNLTV